MEKKSPKYKGFSQHTGVYSDGFYELEVRLHEEDCPCPLQIEPTTVGVPPAFNIIRLPEPTVKQTIRVIIYVKSDFVGLQLMDEQGGLVEPAGTIEFKSLPPFHAGMNMILALSRHSDAAEYSMKRLLGKAQARIRKKGFAGMLANLYKDYYKMTLQAGSSQSGNYEEWIALYNLIDDKKRFLLQEQYSSLKREPLISIIMPVYNTPKRLLRESIDSVLNQIYPNWELCIVDDCSTRPYIKPLLTKFQKDDCRIKLKFLDHNQHISAASNHAINSASGEFIAFLDHDDLLAEHALLCVAQVIDADPKAKLIYSDEDKVTEKGVRQSPHFKSNWNPELLYGVNYINHLCVYDKALIHKAGNLREGFEGSQDYDLLLRASEYLDAGQIHHIPEILYHWRVTEGSTAASSDNKSYASEAGLKALTEHFERTCQNYSVEHGRQPTTYRIRCGAPPKEPLVSLIIPTRNAHTLVRQCIDSILAKTTYKNYEILIIDNDSDDNESVEYFEQLEKKGVARHLHYPGEFNYSAINNFAVEYASGELVGLINNDIEVIDPDWLTEMVGHAIKSDIGAVGAKLLYANHRVQHGGVILGIGGVAGHAHKYYQPDDPGYFMRLSLTQALSAVTAACLVVKKSLYQQVNGLDSENLKVAFNDVDFCLRIRQLGYRNIWTANATLYHHESISRGSEDTKEKQERFTGEVKFMQTRWGKQLLYDPFYNINLTLESEDYGLAFPPRRHSINPTMTQNNKKYALQ